jgi:hypothetical protein
VAATATQKVQKYGFLQDWSQVSQKLCEYTFSKFQQYLRQFSFNMAPDIFVDVRVLDL